MYGNPLNPFGPYWWTGGPSPAIPTRQRSCLKQLCIFELPTTNVSLSETTVDYGIDKCLYNQLPCECYVTVQINQVVPAGGEDFPITIAIPTSSNSTNVGNSSSNNGESKVNVIDHNSSNVIGSDVVNSKEVFAFINKRECIIRFVIFHTGGATPAPTNAVAPAAAKISK